MQTPIRRAVLGLASLVFLAGITGNASAQATFVDWLYGRTPYYKPCGGCDQPVQPASATTPAIAPAATGYGTSAPTPYSNAPPAGSPAVSVPIASTSPFAVPAVSAPAGAVPTMPAATYAPIAACGTCAPVTVGYAPTGLCNLCPTPTAATPTIRYRTTLTRVPVTSYRPVTTTDPATGCPVTCLQPCTTYRWQFKRVPTVHQGCGLLNWRWPWSRSEPAVAPPAAMVAPVTVMPGYAVPMGESYTVPGQPATVAPSPYYGAPGATFAPGVPSGASSLSPVPADSPPTLQPQLPPSGAPTPAYRIPSPSPGNSVITPDSGGTTLAPPRLNTETSTDRPHGVNPDTLHLPTYVKPIPDPEVPLEPPQLLNPRERTAARLDWAVVPISWPAPAPAPAFAQAIEAPGQANALVPAPRPVPPAPRGDEPRWDDSGWKSEQAR